MTVSECCLIKLPPCILFEKKTYLYFSMGNGQTREPALCQLYRRTFVPCSATHPALMRSFATRVARSVVCVCVRLCWAHGRALQKRLKRSRCRYSGVDSRSATVYWTGSRFANVVSFVGKQLASSVKQYAPPISTISGGCAASLTSGFGLDL